MSAARTTLNLKTFGMTAVGRKRSHNEDAILVDDELQLYAVCDGLGGHAKGEVASQAAIELLQQEVAERVGELDRLVQPDTCDSEAIAFMEGVIGHVCQGVHQRAEADPELAGMATTITVLLIIGHRALMGHVGDSRLYLYRDESFYKLSDDHTFGNELVLTGALSPEMGSTGKLAHVLTRALGRTSSVSVDTLFFDLAPGDQLLICSDGLSNYLKDDVDFYELLDGDDPEKITASLINFANASGGNDNISAVTIMVTVDRAQPEPSHGELDPKAVVTNLGAAVPFQQLSYRHLLAVASLAKPVSIPAGEALTTKGTHCPGCFLIMHGEVVIETDRGPVERGMGTVVGLGGMIDVGCATRTCSTKTDVTALFLASEDLERLFRKRPRLACRVLQNVASHFANKLVHLKDASWQAS